MPLPDYFEVWECELLGLLEPIEGGPNPVPTVQLDNSETTGGPMPNPIVMETSQIFVHPDGTNCVLKHFGMACRRHHAAQDVDYVPTISHWDAGSLRSVESVIDGIVRGTWSVSGFRRVHLMDVQVTQPWPECPGCGGEIRNNYYQYEGQSYCGNCLSYCSCHDEYHLTSEMTRIIGVYWCDGCEPTCGECGEPLDEHAFEDEGEYRCADCRPQCEECGRNLDYFDQECSRCGDENGIRPYSHTHPMMWLGGPVDRDEDGERDGYYLGIELEVSANTYRCKTKPIRDWAAEHLTHRDALDLKHDSSVAGFEIVTQPMTPTFFEGVDWKSFMTMLNETIPVDDNEEPEGHGMHVHIGRTAFGYSDVATAAFAYLLAADDQHLVRISRREPTHYCDKIHKPVSEAVVAGRKSRESKQGVKLRRQGIYPTRGAINLENRDTIEIRAAKSTRDPQEFIDSVRVVYIAAEYIRHLMDKGPGFIAPKALHWSEFARWTATAYPDAFASIAGMPRTK